MSNFTKLALLVLLFAWAGNADAQWYKIYNNTPCTFIFYVAAEGPAPLCQQQSTITYSLAPAASISFQMSDPLIWLSGTPPPAGWNWSFTKIGSPTGPYSGGTFPCTSPISNINVCAVGNTACTVFPNLTCMDVTACTPVKVEWFTSFLPDVYVEVR